MDNAAAESFAQIACFDLTRNDVAEKQRVAQCHKRGNNKSEFQYAEATSLSVYGVGYQF
jgi:hypothetical protein